jgi:hypothetical protein
MCKELKPIGEFERDKSKPGGFSYRCKPCNALRSRLYQKQNKEKEKLRARRYYSQNRESKILKMREYRLQEPEKTRLQSRKSQAKHKTERSERFRIYQKENRTKRRAEQQARRKTGLQPKCFFCGSTENLERHHPDYNKPLEVLTVCHRCNLRIHNNALTMEVKT